MGGMSATHNARSRIMKTKRTPEENAVYVSAYERVYPPSLQIQHLRDVSGVWDEERGGYMDIWDHEPAAKQRDLAQAAGQAAVEALHASRP
jgi:hypothetical protein